MSSSSYLCLDPKTQSAFLRSIVERCAHRPDEPTPVAVFDLDGTLMDNRPRTCVILNEFAEQIRSREPDIAAKLASVKMNDLAYLLSESLDRLGIARTDLAGELTVYWRNRFFADEHLKYDVALAGAVSFVRACYEAGAVIVYFTGRDLPLMGIGTFRSLRDLGFPIGVPGTEVVLKPDANMPDEAFKRLDAPKLTRVGRVIAAFDNEPGNCNILKTIFPESATALVDTQHLPGAPPLLEGIPTLRDFHDELS